MIKENSNTKIGVCELPNLELPKVIEFKKGSQMKSSPKFQVKTFTKVMKIYSMICMGLIPLTSQAAIEFGDESTKVKVTGGISYGIGIRADDRDLSLIHGPNAARAGITSGNAQGRNGDDGNVNYAKGDTFSNVIKGFADFNITHGETEGVVRLQAWNDLNLNNNNVPHGSNANGYIPNTPLSDSGAPARAKFDNVIVSNAYIGTKVSPMDMKGKISLGYQNIGWRGNSITGGSLAQLDPIDLAARARPGAFNEETLIPVPSIKLSLDVNPSTNVEAFYQFGFVPNQEAACGSFLGGDRPGDYCGRAFKTSGSSDQSASDSEANFAKVIRDEPKDTSQFGVKLKNKIQNDIELTGALSQYDSRRSYIGWIRGTRTTSTDTLNTDGKNPILVQTYAKSIKQLDLGFKQQAQPSFSYYVDYTFKKDQPLQLPGGDLLQAFAANGSTVATTRRNAAGLGQFVEGWDVYKTSDLVIGGIKSFKNILNAQQVTLRADLIGSYVHELPDQKTMRYGRPDAFGVIQVGSSCTGTAIVCSYDGFTTSSSYAALLVARATYNNIIPNVVLTPSISYKRDIKGWSYDNSINEGTETYRVALEATYAGFVSNITYVNIHGGTYQTQRDKDYVFLSVQKRF